MKFDMVTVLSPLSVAALLSSSSVRSVTAWQIPSVKQQSPPLAQRSSSNNNNGVVFFKRSRSSAGVRSAESLTKASYAASTSSSYEEFSAVCLHPTQPSSTTSPRRRSSKTMTCTTSSSSSRSRSSSPGLTRQEEIAYSFQIRTLRAAMRLRDQLEEEQRMLSMQEETTDLSITRTNLADAATAAAAVSPSSVSKRRRRPTEAEWAAACGISVKKLRRIVQTGQQARHAMMAANVGLVTSIAKRQYASLKQATQAGGGVGTILTLSDMIQEGNLGLMKAAERYQPEKDVRFSTYATFWIRQKILRSIADSSRIIRLPAHVHTSLQRIRKTRLEMTDRLVREPTVSELANELGMTVEKLKALTERSRNVISLERPLRTASSYKNDVDTRTIGDMVASDAPTPEEDAQTNYLRRDVRHVLTEWLQPKERLVLMTRFGLEDGNPRTVADTAKSLGWSRDRVRCMEARALNKLRSPRSNHRLKEYVVVSSTTTSSSSLSHQTMSDSPFTSLSSTFASQSSLSSKRKTKSSSTKIPSSSSSSSFFSSFPSATAATLASGESSYFSAFHDSSSEPSTTLVGGGRIWFF